MENKSKAWHRLPRRHGYADRCTGNVLAPKIRAASMTLALPLASVLFFAVSIFGAWASSGMHLHPLGGLPACYAVGIPLVPSTVFGDLSYTGVLFGISEHCARGMPQPRSDNKRDNEQRRSVVIGGYPQTGVSAPVIGFFPALYKPSFPSVCFSWSFSMMGQRLMVEK